MRHPPVLTVAIAVHDALESLASPAASVIGASGAPPKLALVESAPKETPAPGARRQSEPGKPMSTAERITELIEQRPGIRNAEIADALDIDVELVRPAIHSRIQNSRIIVYKVPGPNGVLINTYMINPKWTPADAEFVPAGAADSEPELLPVRQVIVPSRAAARTPKKKAKAKARPRTAGKAAAARAMVSAPDEAGQTQRMPAERLGPTAAADEDEFTCAVLHDGRGEIRAAGGRLLLTADQVAIVAAHFMRCAAPSTTI